MELAKSKDVWYFKMHKCYYKPSSRNCLERYRFEKEQKKIKTLLCERFMLLFHDRIIKANK